jgi:hypothetical protein
MSPWWLLLIIPGCLCCGALVLYLAFMLWIWKNWSNH